MDSTLTPQPHVVLILCDQLRADALGFMGNPHVRTPNLDRLANHGVVLENLFCQSPVCMASRASLLTGRYPRTTRMAGGSPVLDPRETTIAETLQRAGYRTGMFGKLHLTPQQYTLETQGSHYPVSDATVFLEPSGLPPLPHDPCKANYGFQDIVAHEDILWGPYKDWLRERDPVLAARMPPGARGDWDGYHVVRNEPGFPLRDVGTTDIPLKLHPSWFIADSAREFFEGHHQQQPCFMHVSFVDPHHPFDPPHEIAPGYDPATMPLPEFSDTGELQWPASVRERWADFSAVDAAMTQTVIAYYYAMIETIDRAVGHLLEGIEAVGEIENTLFVFMADHGEFLGDYGLFRKGALHYDCLLRVPGFFSWPGRLEPQRVHGLVQEIDVSPTILGLLNMAQTPGIQGQNLTAGLQGEAEIGRPWIFSESYLAAWGPFVDCWTLRTPTAKLNYYPPEGVGHLFDLEHDAGERHNLFDKPEHRELRDEMMQLLLQALHSQTDPLPLVISQF